MLWSTLYFHSKPILLLDVSTLRMSNIESQLDLFMLFIKLYRVMKPCLRTKTAFGRVNNGCPRNNGYLYNISFAISQLMVIRSFKFVCQEFRRLDLWNWFLAKIGIQCYALFPGYPLSSIKFHNTLLMLGALSFLIFN